MEHTLLKLTDTSFPLTIIEHSKTRTGPLFDAHLHEHHLQIFYFTSGKATMYVNQSAYKINSPDILLMNKGELHYGENDSSKLNYFVFRIDLKLLLSYQILSIVEKYLEPLENGLVIFHNLIYGQELCVKLDNLILECREQKQGYELSLLADLFGLMSELFRNHKKKIYLQEDADIFMKKTRRFANVFDYIHKNYSQVISLSEISQKAHMSEGYFCRMFKQSTGRSLTNYVNRLRIEKSVILLNQRVCNVTEAAMAVGFDDINYFSRVFKKYMKQSPSDYLKNDRRYFL